MRYWAPFPPPRKVDRLNSSAHNAMFLDQELYAAYPLGQRVRIKPISVLR